MSSQVAYDFADKITPSLWPKTTSFYPLCKPTNQVGLTEKLKSCDS